jgi:hypothetical protein
LIWTTWLPATLETALVALLAAEEPPDPPQPATAAAIASTSSAVGHLMLMPGRYPRPRLAEHSETDADG